ncbi:Nucleic acid-binding, OB-fold [Sesbania bispinosa]|nr:Nucleic acid-binding, OB-fold [Sesbania bispinosa]
MASLAKPDDPFALEMVFVDEEGGKIEATVEGHVYRLSNFGMTANGGKFRAANHEFELVADFMGVLTAVSEEINIKKQGRETRGSIRCAVFGDMVDVVAGFLTAPRNGLPVIIIQFAKVNTYKPLVTATSLLWVSLMMCFKKITSGIWHAHALCMKALSFDYALPYCRDCKRVVFDMTARFKIKLLVTDGEDCAQLIMWDADCFALINKTCRELLTDIPVTFS